MLPGQSEVRKGTLPENKKSNNHFFFKDPSYDHEILTCEPHVGVIPLTEEVDFLVVASDGVWDVMTFENVAEFILNLTKSKVRKNNLADKSCTSKEDLIHFFLSLLSG